MATILLSTLLAPKGFIGSFFNDLVRSLEARGHRPVLWATEPLEGHPDSHLPLPWTLHQLAELYPQANCSVASEIDIDDAKWIERVSKLAFQGVRPEDAAGLYSLLKAVTGHVLERIQPDLFVAWNPYAPHVGVAYDICQARGIPTIAIERGLLPDTYHFDAQGFIGKSGLVDPTLDEVLNGDCRQSTALAGQAYVERWPLEDLSRRDSGPGGARHESTSAQYRIAFLTTDDATTGMYPANNADRASYSPFFDNSFDAAAAVALACPEADVLVKSHPSILHLTDHHELPSNAHIVDTSPADLLRDADLTVTMGGSLNAMAARLGKPVVHLVRDPFTGKGIFFEPRSSDDLRATIDAALAATPDELGARRERFHALCGALISKHYICHPSSLGGTRSVADAVALIESLLPETPATAAINETVARLSDAADANGERYHFRRIPAHEVGEVLGAPSQRTVFVDFDHTLFAGNTTEEYLRQARPVVLVSLLLFLIRGLLPWQRLIGHNWFRFRDQAAVVAVTLLMPWNLWRWRRNAGEVFRKRGSHELARALEAAAPDRTVIVSFGFGMLIGPLLKGTRWEHCRRACVSLFANPRTLRRGKFVLLSNNFPQREIATSAFVTDSEDDRDLLDRVGVPLLVAPVGTFIPAENSFYLPMRYTARAKYTPAYVRNQCLLIELPLLALAFFVGLPLTPMGIAGGLALYLSVLCIYETGYFENDQKATLHESAPTLKPEAKAWRDFPLEAHAWIWGLLIGAFGCFALTTTPELAASALLLWTAGLVAIRALFHIYNRCGNWQRTALYPFLQAGKMFAPALILPAAMIGSAALLAHVLAMWMTYVVYRAGGDKNFLYREDMRIFVFILLCAGAMIGGALPASIETAALFATGLGLLVFQRLVEPIKFRVKKLAKAIRNTFGKRRAGAAPS